MKNFAFLSTALAAVLMVGSPAAKAVNLQLSAVAPLESFTFDLIDISFNTSTGAVTTAAYLATGSAQFGLTSTVTAANGLIYTISSSESLGLTTTTDTFTLSTPVNFLTAAAASSINGLQFDVGDANSGNDPVSLVVPVTTYTATGSVTYGATSTNVATVSPTTQLATNGSSYAFAEGVNSSPLTIAASAYAFRTFTYSISYPTIVPEPSTWAMLGLGIIAGAVAIRRRSEA